jgi:hypothetical protein
MANNFVLSKPEIVRCCLLWKPLKTQKSSPEAEAKAALTKVNERSK